MGEPKLPMKGDDVTVTMVIGTNRQQVSDQVMSFEINPRVKNHDHKYMSNPRDVPDQQLRGWEFKLNCDHADNSLVLVWQEQINKRERNEQTDEISILFDYAQSDGVIASAMLHKRLIFTPSVSGKGSDETGEIAVTGFCQQYEPVT